MFRPVKEKRSNLVQTSTRESFLYTFQPRAYKIPEKFTHRSSSNVFGFTLSAESHWEPLFADPISRITPSSQSLIIPQEKNHWSDTKKK